MFVPSLRFLLCVIESNDSMRCSSGSPARSLDSQRLTDFLPILQGCRSAEIDLSRLLYRLRQLYYAMTQNARKIRRQLSFVAEILVLFADNLWEKVGIYIGLGTVGRNLGAFCNTCARAEVFHQRFRESRRVLAELYQCSGRYRRSTQEMPRTKCLYAKFGTVPTML